jgi:hypothetical protein
VSESESSEEATPRKQPAKRKVSTEKAIEAKPAARGRKKKKDSL